MTCKEGVRKLHIPDLVKFPLGAILFYDLYLRLRPSPGIHEYGMVLNHTYGSRY
ncbi:uncharacterized protein METZ01_LOCUS322005 [marine metagenome]|uniref:Uncharacterized protein n=1 Tax=marine metagenome TaxID=408172 RepID=A0A382PB94_9ZZZZ